MKSRYILLIICCSLLEIAKAQVETHYYKQGEIPSIRKANRMNASVEKMPSFDLEGYIKECAEIEKRTGICLFGKGFDISYTLNDGQWEDVDGGRLWSMSFESDGAHSLNFVFEDFSLPEGADLYIYNQDETVVYGPVTNDCLYENGHFLTDIIPGNQVTITLFEPLECIGRSTLRIARMVHGYKNEMSMSYREQTRNGYSLNAACYPEYSLESDGVGLIFVSEATGYYTGSLVMSTDYSFKPYFLTSSVFIDRNFDGVFSDTEKANAENCMVKFRSRYADCAGTTPMTSYTYNQSYFRAAHFASRIGLLELRSDLTGNQNLAWLGWRVHCYGWNSGAAIYHSTNNMQKVALFNHEIFYNGVHAGDGYPSFHGYGVIFSEGKLSGGYVGAPLLNCDNRIIGVTYIHPWDNPSNAVQSALFGSFEDAWYGDGTSSGSLLYWLDPSNTQSAWMNSFRVMRIVGPSQIISSRSYYVQNLPSNMCVSWSLSDSYYNSNCLQQNYPENNHCTITRSSSQEMTNATLTATVRQGNQVFCSFQKRVSTGNGFDGYYYDGQTTRPINLPSPLIVFPNVMAVITSPNLIGATVTKTGGNLTPTNYTFNQTTGVLSLKLPSSPAGAVVYRVNCSDGSVYSLPITNTAGSSQLAVQQDGSQILVSVGQMSNLRSDPFGDSGVNSTEDVDNTSTKEMYSLMVYNGQNGENVYNGVIIDSRTTIDATGWKPGIYIINVVVGKEVLSEKIIVK